MTPAEKEKPHTSTPPDGDEQGAASAFWVFAYGSLMWRPDFPHEEWRPARLWGYHRAMCISSHLYRGTTEKPGLVLGLDRGGSCLGRAFRVAPSLVEEVRDILYAREMVTGVYDPRFLPVSLDDGRQATAWAFIARRDHEQYVHRDDERMIAMIRQGHGKAGRSRDYLACTLDALAAMGVRDKGLARLLALVDGA